MSRFSGKSRGASAKSFGSSSIFGRFSSIASTGSHLSYLFEPLDFSSISDPNVVVSLKNVLKKDSTTKARALEDLVAHVRGHTPDQDGGAEDSLLDAYVQLYPRTSIDNARRVRELSHSLLLELMRSAKRRMEKRIPQIVGSWLAGTFDKDRAVARTANDGLRSFLNTDEKVLLFWKKCQSQLLEYAIGAVQETPDTLSDERSTNRDDSEAKYHRVLGGSLSLVLGLLQRLDATERQKCQENYDQFFSLEAVWNTATVADPFVRRQCYQLMWTCLEREQDAIEDHIPRMSKILVSEAFRSGQTGSATELVKVLTKLTKLHPEIWGTKKAPLSRLRPFLEKGSQGSASTVGFWASLGQLISVMPQDVITFDAAADVLKSLRAGILHREEPRASAVDAWTVYLSVARRLFSIVDPRNSRLRLATEFIHGLIGHYVQQPSEKAALGPAANLTIAVRAAVILTGDADEELVKSSDELWASISEHLVDRLQNSLSEAEEDYAKAQQSIADEGARFFSLVGAVHGASEETYKRVVPVAEKVLEGALEVLKRGIYRPFSAAAVLESAFVHCPFLVSDDANTVVADLLPVNSQTQMDTLLSSPSAPYILSSLATLDGIPAHADKFKSNWTAVITSLLQHPDSAVSSRHITKLIAHVSAGQLAQQLPPLQGYLGRSCIACAQGTRASWELFETCFTFDVLTANTNKEVVGGVLEALNNQSAAQLGHALQALGIIAHRKPTLLSGDNDLHLSLATKLLALTEMPDSAVASQASAMRHLVEKSTDGEPPIVGIIQENLETAGPASLEVDTLVEQASKILGAASVSAETLLPSTTVWLQELSEFLKDGLNPSLSLTSELAGAYFLSSTNTTKPSYHPPRDRKGRSVPARMALYTTRLLASGFQLNTLPRGFRVELICLLYLVAEIVSDQITLMEADKLWGTLARPESLSDADDLVSATRKIIKDVVDSSDGWKTGGTAADDCLTGDLVKLLLDQSKTLSPFAVYSAAALSDLIAALVERFGPRDGLQEWIASLDVLKTSPSTVLPCSALLTGFGEVLASSKAVTNLLNRLVSDVAGAEPGSLKTLLTLDLLNACMRIYNIGELPVTTNRLVFAVRQITSWFECPEEVSSKFAAEACWALRRLLPCIKEMYGPFWEKTLRFCLHLWSRAAQDPEDRRLPYVDASLRLVSALETIHEPNDDLVDALESLSKDKTEALIDLLGVQQEALSHPAEIVNARLCRLVEKVPPEQVAELGEFYSLMASNSRDIQTAAFTVLQGAVSRAQEQLSVDIVLEKDKGQTIRLPDELLSLLLEPPTLEAYPEDVLANYPTPVRGYLLAWHLIFDAFAHAGSQLRNKYLEDLKAGNYVDPLLDFTFDVLGHSVAHPLNLEKAHIGSEKISSFSIKEADNEPEERAMRWLLVHLYYLALKYLPIPVKMWYINCRSKQTKNAVATWTTKHFSPLVISDALDEVAKWASEQEEPAADEKELLVKVSKPAREVIAGYEVDDLQASIAIRIPQTYPLDSVAVAGLNRVAVTEKRWQSWLTTTSGVITFSNGSIVDGLVAFRRNFVGALKGQSECAICYSIIATDKRLPDKRCGTCRNLFHRHCLYQWFQTSNQNTCPLCRNPIDYLGGTERSGAW